MKINSLYPIIFVFLILGIYLPKEILGQTAKSDYYVEIVGKPEIKQDGSELGDTLSLKFNLYKNKDTHQEKRNLFIRESEDIVVTASEKIGDNETQPPSYIVGSLKKLKRGTNSEKAEIPSDITISLLVDRSGSINEIEMKKIRAAVEAFVQHVPDGCLYLSWFHDDISSSVPLTKENFNDAMLQISNKNTALYNAVYTKLLEFESTSIDQTFLELVNALDEKNEVSQIDGIAYKDDAGNVKLNNPRVHMRDLNVLPFPNRKKIDLSNYLNAWKSKHGYNSITVNTQRGCSFSCNWCSHAVFGDTYRRRSTKSVVDELVEIQKDYNPDSIWFVDDVFTMSERWLDSFAEELKSRNVKISYECISRADRLNENVIKTLHESGCEMIWIDLRN